MKIFRILSLALMAVVICAGFAACSNESDSPVIQEEKKMCTVNINVESLVKVEEVPMGRAEEVTEEKNDLYLIAFSKEGEFPNFYAYGLFDNLSNISIQLVEGNSYQINALAVKNAKSKIPCNREGVYANPLLTKLTNSFVYKNDKDFNEDWYFNPTYYILKDMPSNHTYALIAPDLEVYMNNAFNYVAEENGNPISICFDRFCACSAEFKAVDMPYGELKISITNTENEYTSSDIIVQSETQSTFQYITFGHTLYGSFANSGVGVPCILNLTWVKDNTEIPLIPAEITFKRDTKYIITIKVDNTTTPTINVSPITDYEFTSIENIGIVGKPIPTGSN